MTDRQADREFEVARTFLIARGVPQDGLSLEKRDPPEPDILARLPDGRYIALEVVQLLDRNFADTLYRSLDTKTAMEETFETLPNEPRARFEAKYGDSMQGS